MFNISFFFKTLLIFISPLFMSIKLWRKSYVNFTEDNIYFLCQEIYLIYSIVFDNTDDNQRENKDMGHILAAILTAFHTHAANSIGIKLTSIEYSLFIMWGVQYVIYNCGIIVTCLLVKHVC